MTTVNFKLTFISPDGFRISFKFSKTVGLLLMAPVML